MTAKREKKTRIVAAGTADATPEEPTNDSVTTGPDKPGGHDKPKCGGKRRGGAGTCTRPAGWGTSHPGKGRCKLHGGSTSSHVIAAAREAAREEVVAELKRWTLDGFDPGQVDYSATLLQLIAYWRYRFNRLSLLQGEAYQAAERLKAAHASGRITLVDAEPAGYDDFGQEIPESPERAAARVDLERIFSLGGVTAHVGLKFDADRHGRIYPVEEGIRGLEKLVGEASDRLAKYCAMAHTAKVSQQRLEWAQQMGGRLAGIIEAVINAGSPSVGQRLAMQAELERQLLPLAAGSVGSIEGALAP